MFCSENIDTPGLVPTYRMLDANLNRACEGLRVLEDWFRFTLPNQDIAMRCKVLRHRLRMLPNQIDADLTGQLIRHRAAASDCGPAMTRQLARDQQVVSARISPIELIMANGKRIQEACRSLEECCLLARRPGLSDWAEKFSLIRYEAYSLEKDCLHMLSRSPADSRSDSRSGSKQEDQADSLRPFRYGVPLAAFFSGLYGLTQPDPDHQRSALDVGLSLLEGGVRILQYRNKTADMDRKYQDCLILAQACRKRQTLFIVNDHLDLAWAVDADGVHLGQEDLPLPVARHLARRVNPERRLCLGLSTHTLEQGLQAIKQGADYVGVGPVFATRTKDDLRCGPVGLDYLSEAGRHLNILQVAIGGITPDNLDDVLAAGVRCCAMAAAPTTVDDIPAFVGAVQRRFRTESEV